MNELYTQLELAYIRSTGRKYGVANKMAADLGVSRQALHLFKMTGFPKARVGQVEKLLKGLDKVPEKVQS